MMAHQMQTQQRIQQQALQLVPVHVFLPSVPAGTPKPFEMTKKSLAVGIDEREHLSQETRAAQALFMQYGQLGMAQAVLTQPAQATGIAEPPMLWTQLEELHLKNAGVSLKEQAMAQNLIYFMQREQQQKKPTMPEAVAQLVTALTRQQAPMQPTLPLQQVLPPTAQQQPDTVPPQPTGKPTVAEGMEMDAQEMGAGQSNKKMDDISGVHESEQGTDRRCRADLAA